MMAPARSAFTKPSLRPRSADCEDETSHWHCGHFAVHERAEEMADDLREFFRPLRNAES
jgi:hypothetical protein